MATVRIVRPILLVALLSGLALTPPALAQRRDPWRDARVKMVTDYIEREGVNGLAARLGYSR